MNWLALIQGLIPVAITIAQQIHGAKTGPQKLSTATSIIQAALSLAAAAGAVPARELPSTVVLTRQVNDAVASMKRTGELPH